MDLRRVAVVLGVAALASFAVPRAHAGDDYAAMLSYLTGSRIDGDAFRGASGVVAGNLAAGDLNRQANLHALAVGGNGVRVGLDARQPAAGDHADAPGYASASIGGRALAGGSGIASINQASGIRNAQLNAVAASLAAQGIRETSDGALSADVSSSAGGAPSSSPRAAAGGVRSVAVEAGAMRGFEGVLQLNQVAGSDNATGNLLQVAVEGPVR